MTSYGFKTKTRWGSLAALVLSIGPWLVGVVTILRWVFR